MIETRASGEIDFSTREAAQDEADFLNKRMPSRFYEPRKIGDAWYCCQTRWRSPLIGRDGKAYHIEA